MFEIPQIIHFLGRKTKLPGRLVDFIILRD